MSEEQVEPEGHLLQVQKFTFADDILYRQVEHEAILLHIPSGMYYSLNGMGIKFWEALQKHPSAIVIEQIVAEFSVEYSQVHQDLIAFLNDLSDYGIISWSCE